MVVDTGILLEFLLGTAQGQRINELLFSNDFISAIHITPITLVEMYYLVRRKRNRGETETEITRITSIVNVYPLESYLNLTGEIKAFTAISLADCATIALAETRYIPAIFKHENELDEKLKLSETTQHLSRIVFVDDFL